MAMMISKFNKIIHNKTVWLVFAIFISIAFVGVYTGSKTGGQKTQQQQMKEVAGRLFGEDVTRAEFGQSYRNVYAQASIEMMMYGRQLRLTDEIAEVLHKMAWQRLATIKKAEQMGLTVSADEVRQAIKEYPVFTNPQTGQFDKTFYDQFAARILPQMNISPKGFEIMMHENVLMRKASAMASQSALVTEEEIKQAFHLYNDKVTVEYALIPHALVEEPAVTDEEAKVYFETNKEQFRIPENVIAHYIQFAVADYTNSVAVTEEMITSFYDQNKQRYMKPGNPDQPGAEPEYKPIEEVKPEITAALTEDLARRQAFDAADTVVAMLADETVTFEKAAETAGKTIVKNTPAFAQTDAVRGVDPTAPFARAAFELEKDPTHYYSDPVVGRNFVYVIALEKRLPSFLPAFDVKKDEVMEAAKLDAYEKAYNEKAESLHAEIAKALAEGKPFADQLTALNLELKTTAPFSATMPLEEQYGREIASATLQDEAGTLADLIPTESDYIIAYVSSREPGNEATELPPMREELTESLRQDKQQRLIAAWQDSLLEEAGFEDLTKENSEEGEES